MTEQPKRQRRRFTKRFKRDAVELLRSSGATLTAVSAELGVGQQSLSRWNKEFGPETESDRPSYEELERTVRRQAQEIDFLKKASSYFASRQRTGIESSRS